MKSVKGMLLAAVCLVSSLVGVASAETVTLGTTQCGIVKQCLLIPNDAGLNLNLYGAPGYPYFFFDVDGVLYKSSVASGSGIDNALLVDANGDVIYVSATFSTYKTCNRSGRGQTCSLHWSLIGGTLTR